MHGHARDEYLETEVLTAPPQKLQLMLLDATLRFAAKAQDCWRAENFIDGGEAILRCQEIVTEIMAGIQPEVDKSLTSRVSAIYAFVFRCLVAAHLHRDEAKLAEAIAILEIERETWQQVCMQLAGAAPIAPMHISMSDVGAPMSSFSLEC